MEVDSKKLVIIGGEKGGGIATTIDYNRKYFDDYEYEVLGFLNDFEEKSIAGHPVIGKTNECYKFLNEENVYFAFGIHIIGKNKLAEDLFHDLNIPVSKLATVIHGSAVVLDTAKLSPGVSVMAQSYVSSAKLGIGVMVTPGCIICHGAEIDDLSYISMGSIVGSVTKLGKSVSIGMGANVIEKNRIGDYSVIAAGAVVNSDVPPKSVYAGVPAKFIKMIEE